MDLSNVERRIYKNYRNSFKNTNSQEVMYGSNFDQVQNEYYAIYFDYLNNLLLNLISYENAPIEFDSRFCEYCLRMFGVVRVGGDPNHIFVIGQNTNSSLPNVGMFGNIIDDTVIEFDKNEYEHKLHQITRLNINKEDRKAGFVTLTNKYSWYNAGFSFGFNDYMLIERVAKTIALIKATQVFNINQLKVPYIGYTSNKNLTAKNIWNNINAGIPFIELEEGITDINRVFGIANLNVQDHLSSLKDQLNNELNELYTMLGINTVGIDKKERLVSNEANANAQLTEASANIYLDGRNNALELLNEAMQRIDPSFKPIKAVLNQDSANQLLQLKQNVDFGEPSDTREIQGDEENG